ncbi:endonuclease/exonuclease/phosphatase family protein [Ostertagia ostertagi]
MLVPQNSILLWKDPVDPRTNERSNFLSLLFDYHYNENSLLVALRRPLSEPFCETAKKIEFKIQKMTSPPKSKKALENVLESKSSTETSGAAISVEAPNSASGIESMTLEEVMDTEQQLIVGGIPYTVIREPIDIASLSCAIKPLAGCPIYPAVDFRQGSPAVKPTMHWYVYTPQPSGDSKPTEVANRETISLIEGSSRRFSVTNCEYRWTGECYVPSAVDSGKLLLLVADLGPEAIVKLIRVGVSNILADLYLDLSGPEESLFFPYCPKTYQMYEYRYPLLLKELSKSGHATKIGQMRYLSALFESMDLEMCFVKKQKEVNEGSVIAFRRERFELLSSECYWLASLLQNDYCDDVKSVLSTSNASLEIFTTRPTTIQALQAIVAVRQLSRTCQDYAAQFPNDAIRLLFAGDFNSTPDGPVYELLSTGALSKSSSCWKLDEDIMADDLVLLPSGNGLVNQTGTGLTNYTRFKSDDGEERGFAGCLDYIWTDRTVKLHRMAPRPSLELLTKYGAIPSKIAPSDHVPLICELDFEK